jgi:hypothetical protein
MPKCVKTGQEFPSYEDWEHDMLDDFDPEKMTGLSWHALGNWLYSCKGNECYMAQSMVYHVCPTNYNRLFASELGCGESSYADSVSSVESGCALCGADVPEGWKMVMLLEKL